MNEKPYCVDEFKTTHRVSVAGTGYTANVTIHTKGKEAKLLNMEWESVHGNVLPYDNYSLSNCIRALTGVKEFIKENTFQQ